MENNGGDAEEKPFSAMLLHHVMEPTHLGEMEKPNGHAVITGPCGDTDEFFVQIFSSRIREIRFRTTGCFFTIAACDAVAFLAEGRTVREGLRINPGSRYRIPGRASRRSQTLCASCGQHPSQGAPGVHRSRDWSLRTCQALDGAVVFG